MTFSNPVARYRLLREHYRHAHLDVALRGCAFRDSDGTILGYLEDARLRHGRLHLRGWTLADSVTLRLGNAEIMRVPSEERLDVADALGCHSHVGFRASMPFEESPLTIELDRPGGRISVTHRLGIARALARAERRLTLRLWRDALPLAPMVLRGLLRRDRDLPRKVKAALRLGLHSVDATLDARVLARPGKPASVPQAPSEIAVILPVHNAFDLLPETLDRLVRHTDLPCRVLVIEDRSTDQRVQPLLRDWAGLPHGSLHIELLENPRNLGFVGSVNRAFAHLQSTGQIGPVVLLNSDAMVPAGWLSRLVAPLADPLVASATPLSNDAEIFGAPLMCRPVPLAPGQADKIDARLARVISTTAPRPEAPTGVGFCMALSPRWLQRVGGFDAVFGRGYGEEVDWCRRVSAQAGRHVAVPNLFVEHRGGASFGPGKAALIQRNHAVIQQRYPTYDRLVQDFIRRDPLITARMVAALAWADSLPDRPEIPVFIGHSMGGGAEHYLQDRVRLAGVSVVLRFGGTARCRIELDTPDGRLTAETDDLALVQRMILGLKRRRVIYSCAVGDPDLRALPDFLLALSRNAPLELLFHDYLPLSPSYTLLDSDGVYRGLPQPDHGDRAHRYRAADGSETSLRVWRAAWAQVAEASERLVVFSEASRGIVAKAFPAVQDKIALVPHRLLQSMPRLTPPQGARRVLGVLGAIGPQKGAAVISTLARQLEGRPDLGLVLVGRIAPGFPLGRHVPVHGAYAPEDIPALAARYGITHWLMPSVWPETFSYAVHECLATGLPTLAFDLGAQGDAVRLAANGRLLPWAARQRQPEQLAQLIIEALDTEGAAAASMPLRHRIAAG